MAKSLVSVALWEIFLKILVLTLVNVYIRIICGFSETRPGMGVIIFIMQFAILRVFCKSLHATPQALGYNTGTTNNMGTKIDIIKEQHEHNK